MSNGATMFAYSEYFLSCLQHCFTETCKIKGTRGHWAVTFIRGVFTIYVFV